MTTQPFNPIADPARILRDAAEYLDRYGWTQHVTYRGAGVNPMPAASLLGAIQMVVVGHVPAGYPDGDDENAVTAAEVAAIDAAVDAFRSYLTGCLWWTGQVGGWNDDDRRTAGAVCAALCGAANLHERGANPARGGTP